MGIGICSFQFVTSWLNRKLRTNGITNEEWLKIIQMRKTLQEGIDYEKIQLKLRIYAGVLSLVHIYINLFPQNFTGGVNKV